MNKNISKKMRSEKMTNYKDDKDRSAKKPRIVFIEPRGSDDNVFAKYLALPLMGPVYLATILSKKGFPVQCYNENMLGRSVTLSEMDCDILIISALTLSVQRGYKIARKFKQVYPKGKVIMGGIHASMRPAEALKFADYVFVGEGEEYIVDLVENVYLGRQKERLVYAKQKCDMDSVPTPDFSLLKNSKRMPLTPVITSRGCPFDCTFCSVTEMFGKKYRIRSTEKVIEDIKAVKTKKIFFYDDNFTALKKRSYEVLDQMRKEGINKRWTSQVRADVANDPKLVKKMADNGCYTVYVGFESPDPNTLKYYHKSQTPAIIRKSIKTFHDNGISVHGMFMLGADTDTKDTFQLTKDFCHDNDIDFAQFAILTPLPGTRTFKEFENDGRLLHKNWKFYEGLHVVFKPKNMTPYQLQQGMIETFEDFYSYSRAINDSLNAIVDISTAAFRAWYQNVQLPNFSNIGTRIMGHSILKKWIRQNQEYLDFLAKLDLKGRWSFS